MKVSIIMAYHNRKRQYWFTVQSILKSSIKDVEIIVVDDGSEESERVEGMFPYPFQQVLRIESKDRWWSDPCIPFNMGIAQASGDIIILQNPECLHAQDLLAYVVKSLTEEDYISFAAYALDKSRTFELQEHNINDPDSFIRRAPQLFYSNHLHMGWYNHAKYAPVYYHFCSAITRENMNRLGGFDERYANGICFDDNELVERVTRLGLRKQIPDNLFVVHQWHAKKRGRQMPDYREKWVRNRIIFESLTKKEDSVFKRNSYVKQ